MVSSKIQEEMIKANSTIRISEKEKKRKPRYIKVFVIVNGVPDAIRTHDLSLRRRMLYPAELPGHLLHLRGIIRFYLNKIL